MIATKQQLVESFRLQADWCERLDSSLYATMLGAAVEDIDAEGPVFDVVEGFDMDPVSAALALRLMGGVHRLVLMGLAPELAAHYPSTGGTPDLATLADAFIGVVEQHPGYLRDSLSVAPQTNEVGRSTYLLTGVLAGLDGNRMDVRLLELGSSGGLNLLLDHYRYETDSWSWGEQESPVVIRSDWTGPAPSRLGGLSIVDRRGCDVNPLPADTEANQLRLLSFLWPDQVERINRTRGAFEVAAREHPPIDEADAASWLSQHLHEPVPRNTATVLQHSVMWQYLPPETRASLDDAVEEAAARATKRRPFIHVSFEPPPKDFEPDGRGMMLTASRWPGGERRLLARGHPHGTWIHWISSESGLRAPGPGLQRR